ncbi:redoxin domain-containing protein [Chitinophaga sp. SYP-B3965]|uniref:TlpA family protein disulfide reductase n=1 Tax=Chitinophaga sp. SYP-B3965 TaxID=2663120 RepID=UPI0012999C1C|nr:TlpA disulfide reductase family protein [Chitinophaga sp. SYP-B3965]MRG44811.1 redoxin domain-containing protein [Chitinophaga sp. SYP-B3965]
MKKLLSFAGLFLLICIAGKAQQFTPKKGSEGYYKVTTTMKHRSGNDKNTTTWYFKVLEVTKDSLLLNCTLLNYDGGIFNTAQIDKSSPTNTRELEVLALLNRPFLYHFKHEKMSDQPGIATIFNERIKDWQLDNNAAGNMKVNERSYLVNELYWIAPFLPATPDKLPDSWLSEDSLSKFTVLGRDAASLQYSFVREEDKGQKMNFTGNLSLDLSTGMITAAALKSISNDIDFERSIIRVAPSEGSASPFSEDVKTAIAKMSSYSKALKNEDGYDSLKLEKYFSQYDPLLGNITSYRVAKAGMLQGSDMKDKYERYNQILTQIEDAALVTYPHHLFNKLQEVKNISVDSAYNTIRYLSRMKQSYGSWIQHTFAQDFLHQEPIEELQKAWRKHGASEKEITWITKNVINGRRIAYPLAEKLANDEDTLIRNEVYPMYLWVQATKHASNKDSVLRIAHELENIGGSKGDGNPHRYTLLLYRQLRAAGHTREAGALLSREIATMEKNRMDSLNADRYTEQNMLAYACKLKSDELAATDKKASMAYLAKAAKYSPKNIKERASSSFYDRVLLESKESYRADFAEALIAQGNSKEAMKVLTEQLNADPSIFEELKTSFSKNFPQADFYNFFHNYIVRSWKTAPDFTLKSPDDKITYKLADYRGKWLLLDFWGTWCPPCRAEMPKINAFAQKIKGRNDLSFLSIACQDQPEKVISYLAAHNFDMPASMSDNQVQKKYEVPGYPAKFLISPSGTVFNIPFGEDWEKAVEQITGLQEKKGKDAKVQTRID